MLNARKRAAGPLKAGPSNAAPSNAGPSNAAPSNAGNATLDRKKRGKTAALQSALLAHGAEPAMIMVILALMGASGTVRIRRSRPDAFGQGALAAGVLAVFEKFRPRFGDCLDDAAPAEAGLRLRYWEADCQTEAFRVLCGFTPCEMHELFAAFVASSLTSCSSYNAAKGDAPLAVALAAEIGADVAEAWRPRS